MTSQATLNRLYDYILAIRDRQGSLELFKAHEKDIKSLSTMDLFDLFNRVLEVDEPKGSDETQAHCDPNTDACLTSKCGS
ncbi:MAG: hypothetical protein FD179_72 [Erysipelotrichaceae bacterium]|nr:MAG: hypothetical protein FD179_72 [Erysipelotrichaceae bacterium]